MRGQIRRAAIAGAARVGCPMCTLVHLDPAETFAAGLALGAAMSQGRGVDLCGRHEAMVQGQLRLLGMGFVRSALPANEAPPAPAPNMARAYDLDDPRAVEAVGKVLDAWGSES